MPPRLPWGRRGRGPGQESPHPDAIELCIDAGAAGTEREVHSPPDQEAVGRQHRHASSSSPARWCRRPGLRRGLAGLARRRLGDAPASSPARTSPSPCSRRCRSGRASASISPGCTTAAASRLMHELYAKYNIHAILCASDPARSLGLVPQGDQVARRPEGPEDALLRARRQRHAEARRLDPAPAGRRNLPGAAARHHRRHRVLHAGDGSQPRLPPGREVLLLPRLASAGNVLRPDRSTRPSGTRCPTSRRRSSRRPATRPCARTSAEGEAAAGPKPSRKSQEQGRADHDTGRPRSSPPSSKAWNEVVDEQSTKSPDFKKAWDSLSPPSARNTRSGEITATCK